MQPNVSGAVSVCKNCGNTFTGKFCNQCGEKLYHEHDRSFTHLLEEAFHFLTHFEGTFFTTLKAMATRPGKISLEYCAGLRKKYFKPISFFLMMVIIYLLFPVFEGLNMRLYFHEHHSLYGQYAEKQVESKKAEKHFTDEELEEAFHHKGEKTSKFLLFTVLPFMALISFALGFKKRKYYFDHFIFSTEITSFFILWGFLLLPLIIRPIMWLGVTEMPDSVVGFLVFVVFGVYIGIAARRFFGFTRFYSIVFALLFAAGFFAVLEYVYKFLLFFVSIHLM
jgi:hypothetical protein